MKKLTALMLVLSLVTVILCSCSSSEPSSQTAPSVQASKALSEVFADIKAQVQLSEMNEFTNAASLDRYYGIAEADIQEFAGGIGIGNDNAENAKVIGFGNAHGADIDVCIRKSLDGFDQGAGLVHQKDG